MREHGSLTQKNIYRYYLFVLCRWLKGTLPWEFKYLWVFSWGVKPRNSTITLVLKSVRDFTDENTICNYLNINIFMVYQIQKYSLSSLEFQLHSSFPWPPADARQPCSPASGAQCWCPLGFVLLACWRQLWSCCTTACDPRPAPACVPVQCSCLWSRDKLKVWTSSLSKMKSSSFAILTICSKTKCPSERKRHSQF